MAHRKNRLFLGLAALTASAVAAPSAQAQPQGQWVMTGARERGVMIRERESGFSGQAAHQQWGGHQMRSHQSVEWGNSHQQFGGRSGGGYYREESSYQAYTTGGGYAQPQPQWRPQYSYAPRQPQYVQQPYGYAQPQPQPRSYNGRCDRRCESNDAVISFGAGLIVGAIIGN